MGSQTPTLALPYPVGTDLIADGDNAIQALAERVELFLTRTVDVSTADVNLSTGSALIPGLSRSITVPGASAVYAIQAIVDSEFSGGTIWGLTVLVDGATMGAGATFNNASGRLGQTKLWRVTNLTAATHTVALRCDFVAGAALAVRTGSTLQIQRIA